MISRGAVAVDPTMLRSRLPGVPSAKWTQLVHALGVNDDDRDGPVGEARRYDAQTSAGGFGCFDLRPLRLADLKIMQRGRFVAPMTKANFLASPLMQYEALVESLRRYDRAIAHEAPHGMTRSGALALFHRLGPNAMAKWAKHKEPSTAALFHRANGLF